MNRKNKFTDKFFWGAATSGPQSEGTTGKPHKNMYDHWFDIEPEVFHNGIGPKVASDFYNTYKSDLALLKDIRLNSIRTSIQWTRLIKNLETGEPDEDGIRFYNDVINEMIKNNITPIIHLHHFDLPVELYDKYGGWNSKHVVELFVKFASTAFELFGDRVKYWITFNEPIVIVEGGYLYQFQYPNLIDGKQAITIMYNLNLATAKVIEAYRSMKQEGKIGLVLNLSPAYPRSNSEEDEKAAQFCDDFFDNAFLYPAIRGEFPENLVNTLKADEVMWEYNEEEMELFKNNRIDFLGVNYYQPKRVKQRETKFDNSNGWMPDKYFEHYEMPGRRMNIYRGWEIYPQTMYDIAMRVKNEFDNIPWYISENGMGVEGEERFVGEDGVISDDYRIDFLKEHLSFLKKGIEEGSNCFGYHMWTPIDCWSWTNSYKNRYGFVALDLETGKKTIKKSGHWIKEVIEKEEYNF